MQARELIINNPVKMARIYSELEKQIEGDKEDILRKSSSHKKSKKDKKVKKDKSEKKNRDHDRNPNEHDNTHNKTNRSEHATSSSSKHANVKTSDYRADSRERHSSLGPTRDYDRHNDKKERFNDNERNRCFESDREHRDGYRDKDSRNIGENTDRQRHRERYHDSRRSRDRESGEQSEEEHDRKRNREADSSSSKPMEKRYGLQKDSDANRESKSFLGPNPELLKKKTEKDVHERNAALNAVKGKGAVHQLSETERMERLKAMSSDAVAYDQSRVQRHKQTERSSSSSENTGAVDAKFLQEMRNEVYNSQKTSIEERLKQQRHYTQKSADMESTAGFLNK